VRPSRAISVVTPLSGSRTAGSQECYTPLLWAARLGKLEVVALLLDRGADKEAKNNLRPSRLRPVL
jgi:hypothetical protein